MKTILRIADIGLTIGFFVYLMNQKPTAKWALVHCVWISALSIAFSYFLTVDSPRRWHGVVPWLTFREDTVGLGSTSLALGYGLIAYAIVRGVINVIKPQDNVAA